MYQSYSAQWWIVITLAVIALIVVGVLAFARGLGRFLHGDAETPSSAHFRSYRAANALFLNRPSQAWRKPCSNADLAWPRIGLRR